MVYEPYADRNYYKNNYPGGIIPKEEISAALEQASRHIDSLTYNRIVSQGFSNLTEFQKEIIRKVCCQQAEFEFQNMDLIDTVLV